METEKLRDHHRVPVTTCGVSRMGKQRTDAFKEKERLESAGLTGNTSWGRSRSVIEPQQVILLFTDNKNYPALKLGHEDFTGGAHGVAGLGPWKLSSAEAGQAAAVGDGVRMAMGKCEDNGGSGGPLQVFQDETGEGAA